VICPSHAKQADLHAVSMMQLLACVILGLVLAANAAGQGEPGLQLRRTPRTKVATRPDSGGRNNGKDNVVFDFTKYGGAASYLNAMDTAKLQQLLRKAGWKKGKGKLAKLLDNDPALVSVSCCDHHACLPVCV
jgi:hypothetical protein